MHDNWKAIREWRKLTRKAFIAERRALPRREKVRCQSLIVDALREHLSVLQGRRIGFYWPLKGEISLVPFMRSILPDIEQAALPVIVRKDSPLEFWYWSARTELCSRGLWHIPSPVQRNVVSPDLLLVPLVGFDPACYRLGYGGGYYDRTLATLSPRPTTIGIGYEASLVDTIHPQPHDIRLDAIVTEKEVRGSLLTDASIDHRVSQ